MGAIDELRARVLADVVAIEEIAEQLAGALLGPALREQLELSQQLLKEVDAAAKKIADPRTRPPQAELLAKLGADDDGEGKLLLVVLADAMGSGLVNGSHELGDAGRPGKERKVIAAEPLALITDTELRAIRIKDRQRVLMLRAGWRDKLYDSLVAAGARYAYETTTAVVRACRSEKILFRWFEGTRDARHQATLRDQLARVTKRRAEAAE